jgi:hypothetical protein
MNDYLDEDIKFDEGMNVKEDDSSIKSSASTSSFDSAENNDLLSPTNSDTSDNKRSMKSLFKSNVKKVINSLKLSKPSLPPLSEHNIAISFDEIDSNIKNININDTNINEMLDKLTNSFVTDNIAIPVDTVEPVETVETVETVEKIDNVSETIYAHKSDPIEPKTETMSLQTCALILSQDGDIPETIYAHKLETIEETTDSAEEEEKTDNLEPKVNKKKRNKKKKK